MFSGKVVLITGASSGIGAGTAVSFAKEGAKLSLTGRNMGNLEDVRTRCQEVGGSKPLLIPGDMTIDSDVKNILDTTIKTYGRLDVLVNNAGVAYFSPFGGEDALDKFEKIFATNVRSVYLLTNLAVPHLIESKGNVVNISSVGGLRSFNMGSAYCMSKAALDHFTRCAALELAPKQVRVNSVNPGAVESNIARNAGLPESEVEKMMERAKTTHPIGRTGVPEDVAAAIKFLASDQASFITGEIMVVDGGLNVNSPT